MLKCDGTERNQNEVLMAAIGTVTPYCLQAISTVYYFCYHPRHVAQRQYAWRRLNTNDDTETFTKNST